jgi:hypothetical protein
MTSSESYPYTQDSQDTLDSTNSDPDFMNTIITGDESWVYERPTRNKHNCWMGRRWKNMQNNELILTETFPSVMKHDI